MMVRYPKITRVMNKVGWDPYILHSIWVLLDMIKKIYPSFGCLEHEFSKYPNVGNTLPDISMQGYVAEVS